MYWLDSITADVLLDGDPQLVYLLPKVVNHCAQIARQEATRRTGRGHSADKRALSRRRRPKALRLTAECAVAAGRQIVSIGKRVAQEDPRDLRHLIFLEEKLSSAWKTAIDGLRRNFSDGEVGEALGVSKQAVQQKWPRLSGEGADALRD